MTQQTTTVRAEGQDTATDTALDGARLREVLGHYPTGVVVVTGHDASGEPVGMTVGSFTSVSLDPPLIAYLPMRSSRTFERLRRAETFCVNILAGDQEAICRRFASGARSFDGIGWRSAPGGAPVLDDAVGWIECTTYDIQEAGDHYLVLGEVTALDVARPVQPLLFFQGGYGRFTPQSLVALPECDLIAAVRRAEAARGELESLAATLGVQSSVLAEVGGELVVVGAAAAPGRPLDPPPGDRVPLRAPLGELHIAWQDEPAIERWIDGAGPIDEDARERYRQRVSLARERGWAMAAAGTRDEADFYADLRAYCAGDLTPQRQRDLEAVIAEVSETYEPADLLPGERYDVQSLVAPVFGDDGSVELVLRISQLPAGADGAEVLGWIDALVSAAQRLSGSVRVPRPTEPRA